MTETPFNEPDMYLVLAGILKFLSKGLFLLKQKYLYLSV